MNGLRGVPVPVGTVVVTRHAAVRAVERLHAPNLDAGSKMAREDVAAALAEGRVSCSPRKWFDARRKAGHGCRFCWSEDRRRIYVIAAVNASAGSARVVTCFDS